MVMTAFFPLIKWNQILKTAEWINSYNHCLILKLLWWSDLLLLTFFFFFWWHLSYKYSYKNISPASFHVLAGCPTNKVSIVSEQSQQKSKEEMWGINKTVYLHIYIHTDKNQNWCTSQKWTGLSLFLSSNFWQVLHIPELYSDVLEVSSGEQSCRKRMLLLELLTGSCVSPCSAELFRA